MKPVSTGRGVDATEVEGSHGEQWGRYFTLIHEAAPPPPPNHYTQPLGFGKLCTNFCKGKFFQGPCFPKDLVFPALSHTPRPMYNALGYVLWRGACVLWVVGME